MTVKKNNKKGYYISMSNVKAKILKEKIKDLSEFSSLEFSQFNKSTKIFSGKKTIDINLFDDINELVKKTYIEQCKLLYNEFHNNFVIVNNLVIQLDFIKTVCKTAELYEYVKPTIIESEHGFVKTTNLRHPIVERLIDHPYTPHTIELGNDIKGMLIYGINSSGKSVLMKAIGLSIVLAQSGFYVPASFYEFSPYNALYTRITGLDNIFRGLSSFSLEMVELNAILKRSSPKTLVIGDEVCRSTDHISGNAIVASTIEMLSETKSSFMFATHLHELVKLDEIKNLKNVKSYYIHVEYDKVKDTLIYDRKLREGSGDEIYGITVAKHIIHDQKFIDNASRIKDKLMNIKSPFEITKTSRYNANKFVRCCMICGSYDNLETHHIIPQKEFTEKRNSKQKNHKSNLIILCDKCHDKLHSEK
jgi:DNA mismatch repair protein MutS